MINLVVRKLNKDDDIGDFKSGNHGLDYFLKAHAKNNQFISHIGVTYIATVDTKTVGFMTVVSAELDYGHLTTEVAKRLPKYSMPVLRLARLAVDENFQASGIGSQLLKSAILIAKKMKTEYGCIGILVDSKPESIGFYKKYGFESLDILKGGLDHYPEPVPMFLNIN